MLPLSLCGDTLLPAYPLTMLLVFALTLFTSATLLMVVQPIIGKMITPLLGGTPAVWNTCMVFFQAILLAGYAYSHATTKWLGVRRQALLHMFILLTPFYFFPLVVNRDLIRGDLDNPIPQLLMLLVTSVGVPFFVVSTSAPLLQKWFSSTTHPAAKDPYFLYAASNVGSMLALISYPTVVEPLLRLQNQTMTWMVGCGLLVLLIAGCATLMWLSPTAKPETEPTSEREKERETALALAGWLDASENVQTANRRAGVALNGGSEITRADNTPLPEALTGEVTWAQRLRWVLLAAVPSSLMLGATTYMTTDIAAIPLLWVLPLTLYLLSFIIVFSKVPLIVHKAFVLLLPVTALLLIFMMLSVDIQPQLKYLIGIHLATLFVVAMVCHGELARNRPATKHLTEFFLLMSLGGVVGGMFNALVAPLIFKGIVEYQLAIVIACLLLPPLGLTVESRWNSFVDLGLTALCLTAGAALIGVRLWQYPSIGFARLQQGPYFWLSASVLFMLGLGVFAVLRLKDGRLGSKLAGLVGPLAVIFGTLALNVLGLWGLYLFSMYVRPDDPDEAGWGTALVPAASLIACALLNLGAVYFLYTRRGSDQRLQAWLDMLMPFAVLLLAVGLVWGLVPGTNLFTLVLRLCSSINQDPFLIVSILTFGIPALLCYSFFERSMRFGLSIAALLLADVFTHSFENYVLYQERSFFGVMRVLEDSNSRSLVHGTTLHGRQYHPLPDRLAKQYPDQVGRESWPLTYFHRTGPIGCVCEAYNEPAPSLDGIGLATGAPAALWMAKVSRPQPNIAIIGLGTGTLACYANRYQHMTFYEIDPIVRKISYDSDKYFTFIQQAKDRGVKLDLVMGDARLTMERKQLKDNEKYHILVIDAFSSDAIPIHLITYEALLMYLEHMQEDGIICFHISNRYLNLKPVLGNLANKHRKEKGPMVGYYMEDLGDDIDRSSSTWVVLARDQKYLERLKLSDNWDERVGLKKMEPGDTTSPKDWKETQPILERLGVQAYALEPRWFPLPVVPEVGEWSDDYAAILRVFHW
jgi:hypothetical protein